MQRDSRGATREQVTIATGISAEGGFAGGTTRWGSLNAKQTCERGEGDGLLSVVVGHNLEIIAQLLRCEKRRENFRHAILVSIFARTIRDITVTKPILVAECEDQSRFYANYISKN